MTGFQKIFQSANVGFVIVAFSLLISIFYVYGNFVNGRGRFNKDIEDMLGHPPNIYYQIMWWVVTPALLVFVIIFNFIQYEDPSVKYNYKPGTYYYSKLGVVISYLLNFSPVFVTIAMGLYAICQKGGFANAVKPEPEWGNGKRHLLVAEPKRTFFDKIFGLRKDVGYKKDGIENKAF